ncbi:MAG: PIG-L deacetylase family protein [Acidimicrobiales bacterium]
MTPTLLHVAPHADDELIGAPATLLAMRDAGWRVVNLLCSTGPAEQRERRRAEVTEACRRARFDLVMMGEALGDPLAEAEVAPARAAVHRAVGEALVEYRPDIIVCPSPHDRHRGHEVAGRGALDATAAAGRSGPRAVWLWGLWGDLPLPTLATGFDQARLEEILAALSAHGGELERNDYRRLVRGRAEMNASLGPERVFGFGTGTGAGRGTGPAPYVELVTELVPGEGRWLAGRPRWLDPAVPLAEPTDVDLSTWLAPPSITDRYGPPPLGRY